MIDKSNIKSILLLCTGNSCRSVMAEGYLKKRLKEMGKDMEVKSAGTSAIEGFKPTENTIEVMKEMGIDVSGYLSAQINEEAIKKADIILIMQPSHKEAVLAYSPEAEDKIFYLRQFVKKDYEDNFIPDPIGHSLDFYKNTVDVIKESIEEFLKWLKN